MSESKKKEKKQKRKSPATPEKGYHVKHELSFITIYEYISPKNPQQQWWIIENNLYANLPVKNKFKIPVLDGLYAEQGIDDGAFVEIRSWFPKNRWTEGKVMAMAESDNRDLEREYKKMQKFKRKGL